MLSGIVAAHSIAETYAVLTRLPVQPRITPPIVYQVILHNIVQVCTIVVDHILTLNTKDFRRVYPDLQEKIIEP